jgi:phosphoribosylaminoimidazole-succinocarboxamide synthase
MALADLVRENLDKTVEQTDLPELGNKYTGKVRDCYVGEKRRVIIATDRISAFDRVLTSLPFKGQLLTQLSAYWLESTTDIAPNHLIETPDPQAMVVTECEPLKVEFIVRGYLTGSTSTSIWTHYDAGVRDFFGHRLPDGMHKHQKLPDVLLTPTTKGDQGEHDKNLSREELIEGGHISAEDFDRAADMSMRMFAEGQQRCADRGLILVDTKYELGKSPDGTLMFIDEIHTPDSSRFWIADTYEERVKAGQDPEQLDKEYVRTYMVNEHGYRGDGPVPTITDDVKVEAVVRYARAFEIITGKQFEPDTADPMPRLRKNLGV